MPNNKDQHYVPKMLMRRFADEHHLFSFVVKTKNGIKTVLDMPYDNQCQYDFYYGRDAEWEYELGDIERAASPIFDKIDSDIDYYPSDDEIKIIKNFFLAQHTRTPRIVKWTKQNIKRVFVESYLLHKRKTLYDYSPLTKEESRWIDEHKGVEFEQDAKEILHDISSKTNYISDLECIIIHFNCYRDLLLSDDPLTIINPFLHSAGFISIGIIIIMPISTKTMIVFRDPVLYTPVDKIIVSQRENAVNAINMYQAITYDQRLMFKNKNDEKYVIELLDKTKEAKERFIKTGEGGAFGGPDDSFIIQHHPTLLTNYPFYFSSIKKEYRQFKFFDNINYRFYSKKYLERIETMMPVLAQNKWSNIDGKKIPKYKAFILAYWDEHKTIETVTVDLDEDKEEE